MECAVGALTIGAGDTGDIPVTGVGFTPDGILIWGASDADVHDDVLPSFFGVVGGLASNNGYVTQNSNAAGTDTRIGRHVGSQIIFTGVDSDNEAFVLSISSFDADGFTLDCETNDVSEDVTILWQAFKSVSAADVAAAILTTPANTLYTDTSGNVRAKIKETHIGQ